MYRKTQLDLNKEEDLLSYLKVVDPFEKTDVYKCEIPFKLKKHYHQDEEVRYFLSGNGRFIVDGDVVECKAGTLLQIGKGVVHSFEYDGGKPLEVRRFFHNEEGYKEYFVQED